MSIRLQERDLLVLNDIYNFNGLPLEAIAKRRFGGSSYARKRLSALFKQGFLKNKFYNARHYHVVKRIAAIYYLTPLGLRTIGKEIDPRMVVPPKHKLDIINLIGKLYAGIPMLLSARDARQVYQLDRHMPVSCAVPGNPPTFISVIGKNKSRGEEGRVVGFIKSQLKDAAYILISRKFPANLLRDAPFACFVPWDIAPEVLPNICTNNKHYLDELFALFKEHYPLLQPLPAGSGTTPFWEVRTPVGTFRLGELFSGSSILRLHLHSPPPGTLIYLASKKHFHGVKLEQGKFMFYSRKDRALYAMFLEGEKMKYREIRWTDCRQFT